MRLTFLRLTCVALAALLCRQLLAQQLNQPYLPADYVWTSPSRNSAESMPTGGHDIGLNVWVENGELLIYVCQSGWFDANNTLLKAGRLRLTLDGEPIPLAGFRQELHLDEGFIRITSADLHIDIWADALYPEFFVTLEGKKKRNVTLSYESWRHHDRLVPADASQQNSWKWLIKPDCTTTADLITPHTRDIVVEHRNDGPTVHDATVKIEGLEGVRNQLYDPIGGLVCRLQVDMQGGLAYHGTRDGEYLGTDYRAWDYKGLVQKATVHATLNVKEPERNHEVGGGMRSLPAKSPKESRERSAKWWYDFWQRSYVCLQAPPAKKQLDRTEASEPQPTDSAAVIIRNYELMRYMMGCNACGKWPTKFNGGLFTFDPQLVDAPRKFTPDYRCWGGGTMTAQNQRLVYWPCIKAGDLDMLCVQLDTYLRMLPNAKLRTQVYWGHAGACFTEQIENSGLPNPAEYGEHQPGQDIGVECNAWLEYVWDTSLEFCQMALEANRFLNLDIRRYEDLISSCLEFFDAHYQWQAKRLGKKLFNEQGKLVIYPGSGAETYKMAYNPASTVAALQAVGAAWLEYQQRQKRPAAQLKATEEFLKRVPELPMRLIDGHQVIAPAVVYARAQNVETPQMYPVFPWRLYGVGRPDLQVARDTWFLDPWARKMVSPMGWKQDNIWAACLGLPDEAAKLEYDKMKNGPFRFPAFYDIGFDWAPDHNRGGSGMIGLQEMLMQRDPNGKRIELPAWPERWGKVFYKLR